jgi:hypothetical protein
MGVLNMSEIEQLRQRIAALESKLAAVKKFADDEEEETEEKTARDRLAAEIAALERRLNADDEDEAEEEKKEAKSKKADEDDDEGDTEEKEAKRASEIDTGIEDEITTDKYRELQRLQHGTELTTDTMMLQVAPTESEYKETLKLASARLDRVANYLEKHGYRALAFRVDKIADAIDAKIKEGK